MGGRTRVAFHRRFFPDAMTPGRIARRRLAQPHFPVRIEFRRDLRAHPRREPFVEPEIVPPRHRDEIAEPHVGRLVRDHFVDALLGFARRFLRIEQKPRFVVSDPAPILHRATEPARHRDVVELRQRIRLAEVIVEVIENLLRAFECIAPHLRFAFRRDNAMGHVAFLCLDRVQFAGAQDIQITRHRRRGRETNFLSSLRRA